MPITPELMNQIETDRKIAEHVLNCDVCINKGLIHCNKLNKLRGVWEKPPWEF